MPEKLLRVPAIEVRQGPTRRLYLFAVDGKAIDSFASVSRVRRDSNSSVAGYQRPEVLAHIAEIRRYLESDDPMLPNALVIAFDDRVTFEPSGRRSGISTPGTLTIPCPGPDAERRPGFIVDGQQRTAAIRDARVDTFPVSVVGFIAKSDGDQRAQFILVNATKPLPKSLIYELLPGTEGSLPSQLRRRQIPAALVERLNFDADSSLALMIQTATSPNGVIKDNSMLRAIENSITDGALYRFRDPQTGDGDIEPMLQVLKAFWAAVELTFPDAWGLPTRKSRLMHGAGVIALSFVMDAIADPILAKRMPTTDDFVRGLNLIKPACAWTDGWWNFGDDIGFRWNHIQNTPGHVQALTTHLLAVYRASAQKRPRSTSPRSRPTQTQQPQLLEF